MAVFPMTQVKPRSPKGWEGVAVNLPAYPGQGIGNPVVRGPARPQQVSGPLTRNLLGVSGQAGLDGYPRTLPIGQGPPAPSMPEPGTFPSQSYPSPHSAGWQPPKYPPAPFAPEPASTTFPSQSFPRPHSAVGQPPARFGQVGAMPAPPVSNPQGAAAPGSGLNDFNSVQQSFRRIEREQGPLSRSDLTNTLNAIRSLQQTTTDPQQKLYLRSWERTLGIVIPRLPNDGPATQQFGSRPAPQSPVSSSQATPAPVGVSGQPVMDGYPKTFPIGQYPPAPFAPEPDYKSSSFFPAKPPAASQPYYGDLGNSSYLAMNSDWLSRMQKMAAPNNPGAAFDATGLAPTANAGLARPGSVFRGVDPRRVFGDPELASEVGGDTYLGMRNARMRGDQTAATTARNIGVLGQMGQPNPVGAQADRIIAGGPINQPLGPVAGLYGNTPLPGAQAVQPRYSQTVQGAQQSYLDTMAQARANTQARVGQMLAGGGQYQAMPGSPEAGRIGTMQSNVPGGMANDIVRLPNGSTVIQGALPRSEWNGMASNLPGANGRTNGDMQAALQERLAARRATQRAERIVARAPMYGLNARTTPAVRSAMTRLGIPIPGEPRRGGAAPVAPGTVAAAVNKLKEAGKNPLYGTLGWSPVSPNGSVDVQGVIRGLGQTDFSRMSPSDIDTIRGDVAAALATPNAQFGPQQRAMAQAFVDAGPAEMMRRQEAARKVTLDSMRRAGPVTGSKWMDKIILGTPINSWEK